MSDVIDATRERGNVSFGPEDIALLAAGLEFALTNLDITNRNNPTTKNGERDPTHLAKRAIEIVRGSS